MNAYSIFILSPLSLSPLFYSVSKSSSNEYYIRKFDLFEISEKELSEIGLSSRSAVMLLPPETPQRNNQSSDLDLRHSEYLQSIPHVLSTLLYSEVERIEKTLRCYSQLFSAVSLARPAANSHLNQASNWAVCCHLCPFPSHSSPRATAGPLESLIRLKCLFIDPRCIALKNFSY